MIRKKNKYKAVLFDWDGTLQDSLYIWLEVVKELLDKRNIHLSDIHIAREILVDIVKNIERHGVNDVDQFMQDLASHYKVKNVYKLSKLHPHTLPLLKHVKKKQLKIGIVSNTYEWLLETSLRHHDIYEFFDVLVTRDKLVNHKPHPEGVLYALRHLGVKPSEAMFIGDAHVDILAGQRAGTRTAIHFPKKYDSLYERSHFKSLKADHLVRSLDELIVLI